GARALVAERAVLADIGELVPVPDADAAARLLFVEERLDEKRGRQDLVARAVEQIGARHVGGADRLALAAAQAILDGGGNRADIRLLHDERLVPERVEARRVGVREIAARQQFARVEAAIRIDRLLVRPELDDLRL